MPAFAKSVDIVFLRQNRITHPVLFAPIIASPCPLFFNSPLRIPITHSRSNNLHRVQFSSIAPISAEKCLRYKYTEAKKFVAIAKMIVKKVTHVIFDMDGLLIESESAYDQVMTEIAQPFGKELTTEMKIKILGTPEQAIAKIAISDWQLPYSIEQFLDIYREKVREKLQHPPLMPGAQKLVQHLHKHNIPIGVATSSSHEAFNLKTKFHKEFFSLFHHIVCGSTDPEVKNGKPAPDIFLVCASRFKDQPKPEQCLVLEDAPNGVQGAITAGMQAVLVPTPDIPEEKRKLATLVINSLEDFKPELFGLPQFD